MGTLDGILLRLLFIVVLTVLEFMLLIVLIDWIYDKLKIRRLDTGSPPARG
ncbi:MAG: hypothetical protein Q7R64_04485 [bacterium]|nr:hypothetical protein [bacterium]